jgi:succinoglycan biosynthesis protein ExoA
MQDYIVTAIVPCRNERESVERCILSILDQEKCDGGIEVIVVDGLSDDGTITILNRLALQHPSLKVLTNQNRTMPAAVNIGITAARGRYIAIMGAHNRYAPNYLRHSVQVLEETNADNVGGSMVCEGRSHVQRAIALAHHSGIILITKGRLRRCLEVSTVVRCLNGSGFSMKNWYAIKMMSLTSV